MSSIRCQRSADLDAVPVAPVSEGRRGTKAKARSYQEVLAGLAQKLDRAMPPSANVADFNISTDFAYAEQVTTNGVFYVPVLRAILVKIDGGGAGEFLESISGIPLQ